MPPPRQTSVSFPAAADFHGGFLFRRYLSSAVVIAAFTVAGAWAQESSSGDDRPDVVGGLAFVDEVELTVVNIDVFVTDKDGVAVTDLTANDFRVLQDGQEKRVTNFTAFSEDVISTIARIRDDTPEKTGLRPFHPQMGKQQLLGNRPARAR